MNEMMPERETSLRKIVKLPQHLKTYIPLPDIKFPYGETLHQIEDLYLHGKDSSKLVEKQRKRIVAHLLKNSITQEQATLLAARYRGIDYLYGRREKTPFDAISENPLVDVLLLISNPGHDEPGPYFTWATTGPPVQLERYTRETPERKEMQYSYTYDALGEKKTFRTLSRFDRWQISVIYGLYVFAQTSQKYPEIIPKTLDEYNRIATQGKGDTCSMAVGILEVLNNLGLLEDSRFDKFAAQLGDLVLEHIGDYDTLQKTYFYSVIGKSPFWLQRQESLIERHQLLQGTKPDQVLTKEKGEALILPSVDAWDAGVRNRELALGKIKSLGPYETVVDEAQGADFTLDRVTDSVKKNLKERAHLVEQIRSLDKLAPRELRKRWNQWLNYFTYGREVDQRDVPVLLEVTSLVVKYFQKDRKLSRKTSYGVDQSNGHYTIDPQLLVSKPLFTWMLSLRDDTSMASLEKAIMAQPESFALLLRLMTYDVAASFYKKKEADFLFDPAYKEKTSSESLIHLMRNLRRIVLSQRPNLKEVFLEIVQSKDEVLADLVSKKHVDQIEVKLKDLNIEKVPPVVELDKAKKMTRRAFLKTVRDITLLAGAYATFGTAFIKLLSSRESSQGGLIPRLFNEINTRLPERISREELEKLKPFYFGKILQLPKRHFRQVDGEEIGYFPISRRERVDWEFEDPYAEKLNNVSMVDSLESAQFSLNENQLVYIPDETSRIIYPPHGWRIVGTIQEKGPSPFVGSLGEIYYRVESVNQVPKRVALILEKIKEGETERISSRVEYFHNVNLAPRYFYFFPFNYDKALELNIQLANDPQLQQLHRQFIEEIRRTNSNVLEKASEIAVKYTKLYAEYTDNNRYYSLGFPGSGISDHPLIDLANNPTKGYYCEVASLAFNEFLSSGGITVLDQPGFTLKNYESQLWGHIAHQNNVVILPNGEVLFVDMTPLVTEKTSPEDIDALSWKRPTIWQLQKEKDMETIKDIGKVLAVGIPAAIGLYYGIGEFQELKRKAMVKKIEESLSSQREFSELEKTILGAVMTHLALLPYDKNFYDEVSRIISLLGTFSLEKHGVATLWLMADEELLTLNSPKQAFQKLFEKYVNQKEVLELFPNSLPGESDQERHLSFSEFKTIYQVAWLIQRQRFLELQQKVYERLEMPEMAARTKRQAPYKAADILDMIRERLFLDRRQKTNLIRNENIPYFTAISHMLK